MLSTLANIAIITVCVVWLFTAGWILSRVYTWDQHNRYRRW